MAEKRVLVVDFSSDPCAGSISCGREIVLALPDAVPAEVVRGFAGDSWSEEALGDVDMLRRADRDRQEYGIIALRKLPAAAGDPLMEALPGEAPALYSLHMDEVMAERAVPALGLEVLAETDRCAVQAFRLKGKPVWGIQGHPEIDPETMKTALERHPPADDRPSSGLAAISRDIDAHPSCQRPELFAAFLGVRGE